MTAVKEKAHAPIHNENLKNLKPFSGKGSPRTPEKNLPEKEVKDLKDSNVSSQAKVLNEAEATKTDTSLEKSEATEKATSVAEKLAKVPVLPLTIPTKSDSKLQKKLEDKSIERFNYIKKPAVIFIEGFSAFGISNGDGIKDMAENFPGAKLFSWEEKDKIVNEIKKHTSDQPVVLIGHSFGGDTAVEIASELNSVKNQFRPIDLLISLDSVGFNNNIIPINVKKNLNFFQEGIIPFLHGSPNIARNTDHTDVLNELRSELHSKIDDSEEVQFRIFESINNVLNETPEGEAEIVIQLNVDDLLNTIIDSQLSPEKKQ